MNQIIKLKHEKYYKNDPLKPYESRISFETLMKELSMIVPRRIIKRYEVRKMLNEEKMIVTMNFTYYLMKGGLKLGWKNHED